MNPPNEHAPTGMPGHRSDLVSYLVLGALASVAVPCGRIRADLSKSTFMRGQADVAVAGASTSYLDVEYSLDNGSTWEGEIGVKVPLKAVGHAVGFAVAIPMAARADVLLRAVAADGQGSSPEIWNFLVTVTSGDPPPATGEDGPVDTTVPSGGPLGAVILDLNADAETYADNDAVTLASDQSASNNDAAPSGPYGQGAPTFKTTGFPGGLPSYRFDGSNDGLKCSFPTGLGFTAYIVVGNLQGAGTYTTGGSGNPNAPLFCDPEGSTVRLTVRTDNKITVAVNPNIFDLNQQMTAAGYGGADTKHIIRFVNDKILSHFYVYVDGTLVADAPHNGNTILATVLVIGFSNQGPFLPTEPLGMDLGRYLVYDAPHVGAVGAPVETALQTRWGTP